MKKQILSALKVSALAIILSFGMSYALAWTSPSTNPPGGNVSAPLNTSATAQTKAGGLTVYGLDLNANDITNVWSISPQYVTTNNLTVLGTATANDYYSSNTGKKMSQLQSRVSGSCSVGQSVSAVNADGSVTCSPSTVTWSCSSATSFSVQTPVTCGFNSNIFETFNCSGGHLSSITESCQFTGAGP